MIPDGTTFRTSDGYILTKTPDGWTDGDLTFACGEDGLPVDDTDGLPLAGVVQD